MEVSMQRETWGITWIWMYDLGCFAAIRFVSGGGVRMLALAGQIRRQSKYSCRTLARMNGRDESAASSS